MGGVSKTPLVSSLLARERFYDFLDFAIAWFCVAKGSTSIITTTIIKMTIDHHHHHHHRHHDFSGFAISRRLGLMFWVLRFAGGSSYTGGLEAIDDERA